MARNLRDKIRSIVNDAYDLRSDSTVTMIENLIKEELDLRNEERLVSYIDLMQIHSNAVNEFTRINMRDESLKQIAGNQGMINTLCVMNAVVGFLRSRNILTSLVSYDPTKKK